MSKAGSWSHLPTAHEVRVEDWRESRDLPELVRRVRPHTMVPDAGLIELARQVRAVLAAKVEGAFVECGTWRGGASFLMAELLRRAGDRERKVWMFDSFAGIPPPQEIDGAAARAWAENKPGAWYHDNLRVSLADVQAAAASLGLADRTILVKGFFEKTLPKERDRIGPIALLRIDADWHASVRCCLEQLYDQVAEGGLIVFDDYITYEGCAIAVHEFLGRRGLPHRVETLGRGPQPAQTVLSKGPKTWRLMQETYLLGQEIAQLLPPDATFILVDQETLRVDLAIGNPVVPFLERGGTYWGPPADDAIAIRELERLRAQGVRRLVVAWPCFWWLDHYVGFAQHLRTQYRCIGETERLVAFDLSGRSGGEGG